MKWLKSWTLFESKEELNEFIQYLNHDLEEDGFQIKKGNVNEFLNFKYKGAKGDKIVVSWVDSKGDKRTDEATAS